MAIVRAIFLLTFVGPLAASAAGAEPAMGLARSSWELDFEFQDPRRIVVQLPGDNHKTTFWYLLYEVTNRTNSEVGFFPSFRLVTDTLKVVEGGAEVSPTVYDVIASRHEKAYPFFAPPRKVTGPLLQGEENSRASAIVFRQFDKEASSFTVYISGLSGEVTQVVNPSLGIGQGSTENREPRFLLRRTLAIRYDLPGDPSTRSRANPIRRDRQWVMR